MQLLMSFSREQTIQTYSRISRPRSRLWGALLRTKSSSEWHQLWIHSFTLLKPSQMGGFSKASGRDSKSVRNISTETPRPKGDLVVASLSTCVSPNLWDLQVIHDCSSSKHQILGAATRKELPAHGIKIQLNSPLNE